MYNSQTQPRNRLKIWKQAYSKYIYRTVSWKQRVTITKWTFNTHNFWQQLIIFYHTRLANELTGAIESLQLLWFLSNVANSVKTKVLHKMTPISRTTRHNNKLLFKIHIVLHWFLKHVAKWLIKLFYKMMKNWSIGGKRSYSAASTLSLYLS